MDASPVTPRTSIARTRRAANAPDGARSVVRGEQLFAKAKALQAKLREKADQVPVDCTFTPELVTKKSKAPSATSGTAAASRLYEQAKRQQERQAMKAAEAAAATPSFKPTLVSKFKNQTRPSLYDRAVAQRKRQSEKIANGPVDAECSFKPVITRKGKSKGKGARRRLYDAEALKRKDTERQARQQQLDEECTFAPRLVASKAGRSSPTDDSAKRRRVYAKLFEDAKTHQEKLEAAKKSAADADAAECTFTPEINSNFATPPRKGNASRRLYKNGVEALSRREEVAKKAGLEHCTFRPEICPASASKAKAAAVRLGTDKTASPIHERLFAQAAIRPARTDKSEPKLAWEAMLREDLPAGADTVSAAPLSTETRAVFDRLYSEFQTREEKRRVAASSAVPFQGRVDWEIQLRDETSPPSSPTSDEAGSKKPADESLVKRRTEFFERLAADAAKRATSQSSVASVDFVTTLRQKTPESSSTSKAVDETALAAADRLHKAQLASHSEGAKEVSTAFDRSTMMRTSWHATLRTDHPVALQAVVECA